MGDPRRLKKKYSPPKHPWQKERIDAERVLRKEYGTGNKAEIWKMNSVLKHFREEGKKAAAFSGQEQAQKEFQDLLSRAKKLGLLKQDDITTDSVLNLGLKDVMERRLQTLVLRKGLARTPRQARQFITHEHIFVGGKKITAPSYLVPVNDESTIVFDPKSPFASEDHPERVKIVAPVVSEPSSESKSETKSEEKSESSEEKKEESKPKPKERKKREKSEKTEEKENNKDKEE